MSLYELFFEIELSLVDRFKLSPFAVRREKATEVFLLVRRLNNHTEKENKKKDDVIVDRSGRRLRRVPAGDDWF